MSFAPRTRCAPLPRLQPNSGLPEFGRFINWPKSETSDFGWRDREGARNMIKHVTPSPPLPRKRGREQTELAARTDSISPTAFARTSRGFRKKSHDGLSVHGETARDADGLAGDVGGVI